MNGGNMAFRRCYVDGVFDFVLKAEYGASEKVVRDIGHKLCKEYWNGERTRWRD